MKPLFILDWDDSLRRNYSALDWVDYLHLHHIYGEGDYAKHDAGIQEYKKTGDYGKFVNGYAKLYTKALEGQKVNTIERMADDFAVKELDKLSKYTVELLEYCSSRRINLFVLSGSPAVVLEAFFKKYHPLEIDGLRPDIDKNSIYTGTIVNLSGGGSHKQKVFDSVRDSSQTIITIGDSISDKYLLENADISIQVGSKIELQGRPNLLKVDHDTDARVLIEFIEERLPV